jgi:hypothetical protein
VKKKRRKKKWAKEDERRKTKGWEGRSWMETPRGRIRISKVLCRNEKGSDRKKIW